MSSSPAARKVREMFRGLGAPPPPDAAVGNLSNKASKLPREPSDRIEQLNLRVSPNFKRRVRLLATRDDITLSEVIVRAVALYEERYGSSPEL